MSEKAIRRPWQAKVLAQRPALVLAAEDAAALQLGHHALDEVVKACREKGEHDVEAVAGGASSSHSSIWSAIIAGILTSSAGPL